MFTNNCTDLQLDNIVIHIQYNFSFKMLYIPTGLKGNGTVGAKIQFSIYAKGDAAETSAKNTFFTINLPKNLFWCWKL